MAGESRHINYTLEDIERYLQGKMNAKEMHEIERAALQDPFLADAIEGYGKSSFTTAKKNLEEIKTALQKSQPARVVIMPSQKNSWMIAASVLLLVGIGLITVIILNRNFAGKEVELAKNTSTLSADSIKPIEEKNIADTLLTLKKEPVIAKVENSKTLEKGKKKSFHQNEKEVDKARNIAEAKKPFTKEAESTSAFAAASARMSAFRDNNSYIAGRVINKDSSPVVNAEIKINDSTIVTDKNGYFSFNSGDSSVVSNISAMGYKPVVTRLHNNTYNTVVLKDKTFSLSEVVVTGFGTKKKSALTKDTTASIPEGGWESFQEYVYKKLNKPYDTTYSAENEIELEFSINEEGHPYNFKILHSTDNALTNKAIEAIKSGPKWTTSNADKRSRIKLKY